MSVRNHFNQSWIQGARKRPLSYASMTKYKNTRDKFFHAMEEHGVRLGHVLQIRGKHLQLFTQNLLAAGYTAGTIQNHMAAVRGVLWEHGKKSLVRDPNFSNRGLGLAHRNRKGTNHALTRTRQQEIRSRAIRLRRPVFATMLDLQVQVGLRKREVVCADSGVLRGWLRQLETGNLITVWKGTKGGRQRLTRVLDVRRASELIREALHYAEAQGGFLVTSRKGSPSKDLKQAFWMYSRWMDYAGIKTHAMRYAYACHSVYHYLEAGDCILDAQARTGVDLGHGPGRGRYIRTTYCREMPDPATLAW